MKRVIYSERSQVFADDVLHNRVWTKMSGVAMAEGLHIGASEQVAWQNNAPKIKNLLDLSRVNDVQVAFEYCIPYNNCRIDCMIYGRGADGCENALHIELKQWSNNTVRALPVDANFEEECDPCDEKVEALTGRRPRVCAHPSQQVRGYDGYLRNFVEVFSVESVKLTGVAYCYNYLHNTDAPSVLFDDKYAKLLAQYPTYAGDEIETLASAVRDLLCNGDGLSVFNKVQQSRVMPSKKLLDEAARLVHDGKPEAFSLLQDQIVAKNMIMSRVRKLGKKREKSVLLVKGGPGTGKTVIALHVLSELSRGGMVKNIRFATKSKPLLEGVKHCLPRHSPVEHLFTNTNAFMPYQCEENNFDVVLIDEAHRIQKSPNTQYMKAYQRTELSMVDMIIRAAKICVMFIDDKQAIRSLEIGSEEMIRESAEKFGAEVDSVELKSQFRCNGSDNYLDWLEQVLYNRPVTARVDAREFDLRFFETPQEVYDAIRGKCDANLKMTARLMAGFCWPWSDQLGPDGDLVRDVKIGDFAMPWETKDTIRPRPRHRPEWYKWAYDPRGLDQVGCIYTAQGFEFDYAGVIIGPDFRFNSLLGKIETNYDACKDPVLRRGREKFDVYVRNIYRVLMSRGMKGCYVYCCDRALAEYLKEKSGLCPVDSVPKPLVASVPKARIIDTVESERQYVDFLPFYEMRAACGYFGDGEGVDINGWVEVSGVARINRNMFVVRASGRSMEPLIHDGDLCVFRANPAGTRQGKVLLVQHRSTHDPDTGGAYSIKKYSSEKSYDDSGVWQHEKIVLKPLNPDYESIVITENDDSSFSVVAELVKVL